MNSVDTAPTTNEAISGSLHQMNTHQHDSVSDMEKGPATPEPLSFENSIRKSSDAAGITLVKRGKKYKLSYDGWYRNDLMLLVGYLEFFNALDFPANVWNDIPIPTFAKALMITGGTLILLASTLAAIDLHRSLRNIRKLRKERAYLQDRLKQDQKTGLPTQHWEAWLELNFREVGWEIFDRFLMDSFVGFSSILVGPGTIMAVAGADPRVFRASNYMSGYVGNSFVAAYGLINSFWAAYLFVRATRHKRFVLQFINDRSLKRKANIIFKRHQIYAGLNGFTLLVSGAGSMISATMWQGYVVLIPCIVSSVYCNVLWRKSIGYDRRLFPSITETAATVLERIQSSMAFEEQAAGDGFSKVSQHDLLALIEDHSMTGSVAIRLASDDSTRRKLVVGSPASVDVDSSVLGAFEKIVLAKTLQTCVRAAIHRGTLDEERFLFELLGSMLSVGNKQSLKDQ